MGPSNARGELVKRVGFYRRTTVTSTRSPGGAPTSPPRCSRRGLWHDLGKFPAEWQAYLRSKADPHIGEINGKMDHATAGAHQAVSAHGIYGHLMAYGIAGHHSGLLDATSNGACQAKRLVNNPSNVHEIPPELISISIPALPPCLNSGILVRDGYAVSLFTRLLFSCLVDADFLATEAFMNPEQVEMRNEVPGGILAVMAELVQAKIDAFGPPAPGDTVNEQRRRVVDDCLAAAGQAPGFFSLTVPTGGGKTLSSLLFALRHAIAHGKSRIIYVVPFTSIIEQNAEVIREILAPLQTEKFAPLIEHHSSLSPEDETTQSRLAAENWDAPIVITTAVQFYESLHASKTSRCRKLHRIANSVVILDESQTLPVDFLAPCLRVLQELADRYHTTTVLCTATQPAVHHDANEFPIGLRDCREIISDPPALFAGRYRSARRSSRRGSRRTARFPFAGPVYREPATARAGAFPTPGKGGRELPPVSPDVPRAPEQHPRGDP
jgi:CRISPR-associated endonuclease/helicase Cas3